MIRAHSPTAVIPFRRPVLGRAAISYGLVRPDDLVLTMTTPAPRSASDFQLRRAHALCVGSPALQAGLETFLRTTPNYTQMDAYLSQLKSGIATSLAAALLGNIQPLQRNDVPRQS